MKKSAALLTAIALVSANAGLVARAAAQAVLYHVTDLGILFGGTNSYAYGINASGEVVGSSTTLTGATHAFLYSNGVMRDLGTLPGGNGSVAVAINASGQIVGSATFADQNNQAFLYSNGVMQSIAPPESILSSAVAINVSGQIVGPYVMNGGSGAFLYSNGSWVDLGILPGAPPGSTSAPYSINDSGKIVGTCNFNIYGEEGVTDAFLYTNGTMQLVGTNGVYAPDAYGINASGQIVGDRVFPSGLDDAYLYSDGTWRDLGNLGGNESQDYGSVATAINTSGEIVGYSQKLTGFGDPILPFRYSNGVIQNLNSMLDFTGNGVVISYASGINDKGQIACYGTTPYSNGFVHALLLTRLPTAILSGPATHG